jgi:peptide-methionine (R)-S-oxide reductase
MSLKRRRFLLLIAVAPLAMAAAKRLSSARAAESAKDKPLDSIRKNWKSLLARDAKVSLTTEPLRRSRAEWKKILTPAAYYVLREEGTERPFTSPLNDEKRPGVFVCAGCDLPLFTSQMKFDSGTGWPSFFTHIPGHFGTKSDYKLILPRTEYHCIRCGGHHGHVFDDGPPPTGQRWCNNGVALRFIPA